MQRSPIFSAMEHTSVFPIAEKEVAAADAVFSPQKQKGGLKKSSLIFC
jgi:hypothetical protein